VTDQIPKEGRALDLLSAAKALPARYKKISGMIVACSSAHSIRSDLDTAFDMLRAQSEALVIAKRAAGERSWASDAALALINTVVILYARATKTSSKHRGTIDFRSKFSDIEVQRHEAICKLRDDAIAHFGPGDEYGGPPWQIEAVYLPVDRPDNLKIMAGSRRIIEQKQLQGLLKSQVHRALIIAEQEARKRISALTEELNENAADGELRDLLWKHEIDLVEFFQTEEERDKVMGQSREGKASGYVRH
jgi:hypothetical protein